jgi:hypothetical protein
MVTLWTMRCAFLLIYKLEARKHDFLTSGCPTGTYNKVVIQWVRLGIFKVEKMNQEGYFQCPYNVLLSATSYQAREPAKRT